jgi:hypothetical protein
MAANALVSQHRFTAASSGAAGAAGARDLLTTMVVASSITEETLNLIRKNFNKVMTLAGNGGAPGELLTELRLLVGGSHPASPVLSTIRNKLGFHWDEAVVQKSLEAFKIYESLIWAEGRDRSAGEVVYRLSTDVLTNAIWPETEDIQASSPEELARLLQERTKEALEIIVRAMSCVEVVIQHAVAAFVAGAHATQERRS